jgi:AcrR family transcriptional regulator
MSDGELERLAAARRRADARAINAYAALLDRALLEAGEEGANVRDVARRAGLNPNTIYNELARRRARAQDPNERTP